MKIESSIQEFENNEECGDRILIDANLPKKNHNQTDSSFRGSTFRGASKNRKKWQVMKMINKQTVRIGTVQTEIDAARIFDFLAILSEGLSVSTFHIINYIINFKYYRPKPTLITLFKISVSFSISFTRSRATQLR